MIADNPFLEGVELGPAPQAQTSSDAAPWLHYSRFVARPVDGGWHVVSSYRNARAPEPSSFPDYGPALRRADALNDEERDQMIARGDTDAP